MSTYSFSYFILFFFFFFFQAEDGIRDRTVTGVQTCALPISWVACAAELGACPALGQTCAGAPSSSDAGTSLARDGLGRVTLTPPVPNVAMVSPACSGELPRRATTRVPALSMASGADESRCAQRRHHFCHHEWQPSEADEHKTCRTQSG